ncbi:MAG TPA: sigma-70 family RNA polymerase sigma factor [Myxococcales bacterium]|jgi:RNA polymerase sigma-70 factor (ECF subfamily)|nr:sigma-70 family RNA polymerase sigma factor [Myxococcales bacterium]
MESDARLVERVVGGERQLFAELMRRCDARIHRVVSGIIRDSHAVEDVVQQSYLLAYVHLGEFTGSASFTTWLTRIAINEAFGSLRRSSRLGPVLEVRDLAEDELRRPAASPEEQVAASQAPRLLEAAVRELQPSYRATFVLREVEQLTTRQASDALGITGQSVKVRLHRARRALRASLSRSVGKAALV